MSETKLVQHVSGQGEMFEVFDEALNSWRIRNEIEFDFWLPKSEYRLCEPPEVFEDVTKACTVENGPYGPILKHDSQRLSWSTYRIRKVELTVATGDILDAPLVTRSAFIVERSKV